MRKTIGVPLYTGLPFGHVPRKLTLPVGGRARLAVRRGGRTTLELSRYPTA
jgi:muramoyltetrapeptide carboxypeptidase